MLESGITEYDGSNVSEFSRLIVLLLRFIVIKIGECCFTSNLDGIKVGNTYLLHDFVLVPVKNFYIFVSIKVSFD